MLIKELVKVGLRTFPAAVTPHKPPGYLQTGPCCLRKRIYWLFILIETLSRVITWKCWPKRERRFVLLFYKSQLPPRHFFQLIREHAVVTHVTMSNHKRHREENRRDCDNSANEMKEKNWLSFMWRRTDKWNTQTCLLLPGQCIFWLSDFPFRNGY